MGNAKVQLVRLNNKSGLLHSFHFKDDKLIDLELTLVFLEE
jgi:hypothetical protein